MMVSQSPAEALWMRRLGETYLKGSSLTTSYWERPVWWRTEMRRTERIITEDVEPSLVLSKLTSVASGPGGERDETV